MLKLLKGLKAYIASVCCIFIVIIIATIADLTLPNLMSDIVNVGIVAGDVYFILGRGGLMLGVALIGMVCTISSMFLASRVGSGFSRDLRKSVFEKVESFSLNEMNEIGTASLITRTTNDINQIQMVLILMLRLMVSAPITIVGAMIMSLQQDASLSTILWVAIPVIIISIVAIAFTTMPMFKEMQKRLDNVNLVVREKLTGIRVIRVFNKDKDEEERFDEANDSLASISIKANRLMSAIMPLMMLILNVSIVALVWFGGIRVDNGEIMVGNLMAMIQYFMQLLISLLLLTMVFSMIPRAQASAIRINEILEMESPIQNPKTPTQAVKTATVEFKNVSFGYEGAEEYAIANISFTSNPGEVTAIIGGTGSGKSSILNLIPRFYDVAQGEVLVNGVDVREWDQKVLREKIGYVPQKAVLFSGSIRENLLFGNEKATELQMNHALDIAQGKEFVSKMKDGLDAHITQGGTNVSGGQKQRLSIARAIVRQPEIYLFDDSFSALDFKTDAKLREALKKETQEATVIIVAQRVSTVMDADRILVMNEGRVVGMGTHDELVQSNEVYQEIVASQLKRGEEE